MRVLRFDQFEFENPESEEHLEIALSEKGPFPHPDLRAFVASAVGVNASERLPLASAFSENMGYGLVREYLRRFAGLALPDPCTWPTYVLKDNEEEFQIILDGQGLYVAYSWGTSA